MFWTVLWLVVIGLCLVNVMGWLFLRCLEAPEHRRQARRRRERDASQVDPGTRLAQIRAGNARYYATLVPQGKPRIRVSPRLTRVQP